MRGMDDWVSIALVLLAAGLLLAAVGRTTGAAAREQARTAARLDRLQRSVDAIAAQLRVDVSEPQHPEVERLVEAGQKIQAIRRYREETGADLVSAKNAVDEMVARRG